MSNFENCYSYENIKKINDKLSLNFNDEDTRVLQHRLYDFNKMMNILFIDIYENKILGSKEPFLNDLKSKVKEHTNIALSNTELSSLITMLIKNKNHCKKAIHPVDQTGGNLAGMGWLLPSDDIGGKSIDVFSLLLDFIGLIPGFKGNFADIINFIMNIFRRRYFDAGMSFLGLFSYIGLLAPFGKIGFRYLTRSKEEEEEEEEEEGDE